MGMKQSQREAELKPTFPVSKEHRRRWTCRDMVIPISAIKLSTRGCALGTLQELLETGTLNAHTNKEGTPLKLDCKYT